MTYLGEFRAYWRSLAAASIGLGAGYTTVNYINNLFTPHLLKQFSWSRSDIALVGMAAFLGFICQPIAGRLTDVFGVRRMALIGVIGAPVIFIAMSAMNGEFTLYFLFNVLQVALIGGTTSPTIYSRLIAQKFDLACGMALAIAICTPAAVGGLAIPFLSHFVDIHGWRAGYMAVAVGMGGAGLAAILLMPAETASIRHDVRPKVRGLGGYNAIFRSRAFQLIIGGMFLCNLSFSMQASQLKVILLDRGIDSATGSLAISLFAFGTIAGRFLCGLALDRFPAHLVTAVSLSLPSLGLLILASGIATKFVLALAVLTLGMCVGAEGDVIAYLVMRYFKLDVYSSVLGLVLGVVALSISLGSILLSLLLKTSGAYTSFLVLSAVATLIGGSIFLLLGRVSRD